MKRKQNGMYDHINSLQGNNLWNRYVTYTLEFDRLHMEVQDMRKALTYNRNGKEFIEYIGEHRFYIINLCRYYKSSYSWKVYNKLSWVIERYKSYIEREIR